MASLVLAALRSRDDGRPGRERRPRLAEPGRRSDARLPRLGLRFFRLLVDAQLQLLPGLEEGNALRRDRDGLAGLRVQAFARVAALDDEASEAADLDALAAG